MRINKHLAHTGVASRREADVLIEAGNVLVNGTPASLGQMVEATDTVTVKKTGLPKKRYFVYYKGRGVITHSPADHEVDVATKLSDDYGITGVAPIGRLDKDSEGLILLSDDGRITGPLLDPDAGHEREYDVTVDKPINQWFAKHMSDGVNIEGYTTKPARIETDRRHPNRFRLVITEGKKHQIRRMCAALGFQVTRLKRVRIMHIGLDQLKPNQYRKLTGSDLHTLFDALGMKA